MTDDAFLAAILAAPDDDAPWLIFADWLDERGDPRAGALRAHPEFRRVIVGMMRENKAPLDFLDRHILAGHTDFLRDFVAAVELFRGPLKSARWPGIVDSTLDHLERSLALTPGARRAEASLVRNRTPAQTAVLAALLAQGQRRDVLLALFKRHGQDELLACLAHEMVVRGHQLTRPRAVSAFWARVRAQGHPLAGLPAYPLPIEGELASVLPHYNARGYSCAVPFQEPAEQGTPLPPAPSAAPLTTTREPGEGFERRAGAAVRNWQAESNGRIEAGVFRASRPVQDDDLSVALVRSLGMECLAGLTEGGQVGRIRPSRAMTLLFAAAANGGAYNRGLGGAYGRLAAWESLGALAGAAPGVPAEDVAGLAERCLWLSFTADSDWFYNVAWDLGLVAIRPDRETLAVLAATDTD
jgi:uncharacterized protein (TIGR02996 family)